VHTIAFGGSGAGLSIFGMTLPMPGGNDGMDEATLQAIARETGGRSLRARDTRELLGIYDELDRIEPVKQQGQRVRPRIERYYWPLSAALLVALLAFLIPRRRL
ncbi:MAG: VWA domain-containing protein, partial [Pseudoxanthomonas sp.]|nr:VWA domain-containing protein [Pseudoxanthomonas sp.]